MGCSGSNENGRINNPNKKYHNPKQRKFSAQAKNMERDPKEALRMVNRGIKEVEGKIDDCKTKLETGTVKVDYYLEDGDEGMAKIYFGELEDNKNELKKHQGTLSCLVQLRSHIESWTDSETTHNILDLGLSHAEIIQLGTNVEDFEELKDRLDSVKDMRKEINNELADVNNLSGEVQDKFEQHIRMLKMKQKNNLAKGGSTVSNSAKTPLTYTGSTNSKHRERARIAECMN